MYIYRSLFIYSKMKRHSNDAVHWFVNDLTSRIVAQTGKPSDRYHIGKILLQSLKDDPELVMQVRKAVRTLSIDGIETTQLDPSRFLCMLPSRAIHNRLGFPIRDDCEYRTRYRLGFGRTSHGHQCYSHSSSSSS